MGQKESKKQTWHDGNNSHEHNNTKCTTVSHN